MCAKEYLNKIRTIDMMINSKVEQVEELRCRLTNISCSNDGDRVQTSLSADKFTDTIAKIIELENKINADIDALVEYKDKAREMIECMCDDVEKVVLYDRYFNNMSFEQIAVNCGYSWRHIHRIHANALRNFEDVMECHIKGVI